MRWILICLVSICLLHADSVLLFKNYEDSLISESELKEYLVSEKLDGVRAIWNGKELKTRNGKIIHAPLCFIESFPRFYLDGELWTRRNDFENISSIVLSKRADCNEWQGITYNIFDVAINSDKNNEWCEKNGYKHRECSLSGRLSILEEYLIKKPNKHIRIIKQEIIESKKELFNRLNEVVSQNGEGLIIRLNKNAYKAWRSSYDLKLKPMQDSECKVVGYTEGKGRLEGKIGAIICTQNLSSLTHNKMDSREISFKIGSGLSDEMRANPPKINSIITYRYRGLTKNKIPRFPTFLRVDGLKQE